MAEIEYFYSAHSYYAYIGSARFMEVARAAGRRIVHKPFHLDRAIQAAGSIPFKERSAALRSYYFRRESERWAEERNVPVMAKRPTYHDEDVTLANTMLIACIDQGLDIDRLAHAALAAHWTEDADLSDAATLGRIAASVGIDAGPLLEAAATPELMAVYEANTGEAIARAVLGSPTYVVDGDMFYGQDRLEMVARALDRPYTAVTFER